MSKLEEIKQRLGKSCTHLSSIQTKVKNSEGVFVNVDGIKAVILNEEGGKDKVEIILPVKFGAMQESNFEEIYNYIKDKKYDSKERV